MGGFLPVGYPYNSMPYGQFGTGQSAAANTPNPSTMTPQQMLAYYEQLANTPQGQAAQQAQQQTIAMNVKQALAALQNEKDRIAIAKGQAEADKWYKQESLKLAQQAHQLAVQVQQQNYGLAVGAMTGTFNGAPTLAAKNQEQQYALQQAQLALNQLTQQQQHELAQGTLNLATLSQQQRNAIEQAQLGLNQAGVTGEFNGKPTLAALAQQQNFGLSQAGVTGMYNGAPTLAAQAQQGQQTGYYNGQATLSREQAAANTALQAAQLGASLRGPGDWAQYLQAANGVAGSPASALVASVPGGMGQMQGNPGGPVSLAQVLGQFGVMPGQGAPGGPAQYNEPPMSGGMPHQPAVQPLSPQEAARYAQLVARTRQLQAAGEPVPPTDAAELAAYQSRGGAPLSPQEQARYQQLMARRQQLGAAGEGDLSPVDLDELGKYQARQGDASWNQPPQGGYADPVRGGGMLYAGGTPGFNEKTGSYSSAPAGGMRSTMPVGANPAGSRGVRDSGPSLSALMPPQQPASQQQGWNPYSMTGAIGQQATPAAVTNAQLGLSDDEAGTLKNAFRNPHQMASTWWSSKSADQKAYLGGLNEFWGGSNATFQERERNARPRQGAWNSAV